MEGATMKRITVQTSVLITMITIAISGCAMKGHVPVPIADVRNAPNLSKEQIYNRARQWFSEYFVSGKSVVDYEDKATGTIIGNGVAENGSSLGIVAYSFRYTLRIDTKDGRFKTTTTVVKHMNTDSDHGTYDANYVSEDRENTAKAKVKSIVDSLHSYILKNAGTSNW